MIKRGTIINIRKLVALDIVYHGYRFILAEFALAVLISGGIGIFILSAYIRNPDHPLSGFIIGLVLIWIALNYVPLLVYAISIARHKSAQQEVAYELEHKEVYRYTFQSIILLLLPLIVPIAALVQEIQKHTRVHPL